jgi:hypothetical protein
MLKERIWIEYVEQLWNYRLNGKRLKANTVSDSINGDRKVSTESENEEKPIIYIYIYIWQGISSSDQFHCVNNARDREEGTTIHIKYLYTSTKFLV